MTLAEAEEESGGLEPKGDPRVLSDEILCDRLSIVGEAKRSATDSCTLSFLRMALTSCPALSESPPRSKKLSMMLIVDDEEDEEEEEEEEEEELLPRTYILPFT